MTSRKIMRCRGARGHLVLYNPLTVPHEEATGCLADVMISQRKGEFPPVAFMVSVHEKLAFQVSEKADELNKRMNDELLTRKHAMDTLQASFPFLSDVECDMLLDLFGNIASIAQAGAEKLLDVTVLSTSAAHAIEHFFKTEYVVE
ncbi:unnamed protein product [Peronospora belbahrii]|uniref:Uncharacterized protein n=1 Tax=Peronospora belbahrii TaxID=622444 RepID=A0AAU9KK48_9STRA|nr:unnamed protein product [Peronospora belbahrii]CAH0514189.1 unnamed protein product [Peronospora belbahrii]